MDNDIRYVKRDKGAGTPLQIESESQYRQETLPAKRCLGRIEKALPGKIKVEHQRLLNKTVHIIKNKRSVKSIRIGR